MVKLLVPFDQTAESEGVLDLAVQAAERLQAEVHLLTVIPPGRVHGTFEAIEQSVTSAFSLAPASDSTGRLIAPVAAAYLAGPAGTMVETHDQALSRAQEAASEQLHFLARAFGGQPVHVAVALDADPTHRIVRYAREEAVDLIVMATHGRMGVGRALLGSVAETVVRDTGKPVFLIGPHADPTPRRLQSLLLCLDGSPLSESILPVVTSRARAVQLRVVLLQVTPPSGAVVSGHDIPEAVYVERLGKTLRMRGIDAQWEVLHGAEPAAAIADYAAQLPGSIVALGTHSRMGFSRFALGSVAMRIVHASPTPVLVLHARPAGTVRDARARPEQRLRAVLRHAGTWR